MQGPSPDIRGNRDTAEAGRVVGSGDSGDMERSLDPGQPNRSRADCRETSRSFASLDRLIRRDRKVTLMSCWENSS
jgi:hypothetical protein